uniref:Uncharacterized protein n=1 Tax=Trypanosoma congolense (strain IL3000) TaxID=1068625 RepID=G0UVY4_TRYCI|nr:conserved hypothetical protein [Trypanosoma congolense IL3000]
MPQRENGQKYSPRGSQRHKQSVVASSAGSSPLLSKGRRRSDTHVTAAPVATRHFSRKSALCTSSLPYADADCHRVASVSQLVDADSVANTTGDYAEEPWRSASSAHPRATATWSPTPLSLASHGTTRRKTTQEGTSAGRRGKTQRKISSGGPINVEWRSPNSTLTPKMRAEKPTHAPPRTGTRIVESSSQRQTLRGKEGRRELKGARDAAACVRNTGHSELMGVRKCKKGTYVRKNTFDNFSESAATDRSFETVFDVSHVNHGRNGVRYYSPSISNNNLNDEVCTLQSFSSSIYRSGTGPVVTEKWARSVVHPQDEYLLYDYGCSGPIKQEDLVRRGQVILLQERARCEAHRTCSAGRIHSYLKRFPSLHYQRQHHDSEPVALEGSTAFNINSSSGSRGSLIVQMNERKLIERGTPLLFRRPQQRLFNIDETVPSENDFLGDISGAHCLSTGLETLKGQGRSDTSVMVSSFFNPNFNITSRHPGHGSAAVVTDIATSNSESNAESGTQATGMVHPRSGENANSLERARAVQGGVAEKVKGSTVSGDHFISQLLDNAALRNSMNLLDDPLFVLRGDENHERLLMIQEEHEARVAMKQEWQRASSRPTVSSSAKYKLTEIPVPQRIVDASLSVSKKLQEADLQPTEKGCEMLGLTNPTAETPKDCDIQFSMATNSPGRRLFSDEEAIRDRPDVSPKPSVPPVQGLGKGTSPELPTRHTKKKSKSRKADDDSGDKSVYLLSVISRNSNGISDGAELSSEQLREVEDHRISSIEKTPEPREPLVMSITPLDFSVLKERSSGSPSRSPIVESGKLPQHAKRRKCTKGIGHDDMSDNPMIQSITLNQCVPTALRGSNRSESVKPNGVSPTPRTPRAVDVNAFSDRLEVERSESARRAPSEDLLLKELEEFVAFMNQQKQELKVQREMRNGDKREGGLGAADNAAEVDASLYGIENCNMQESCDAEVATEEEYVLRDEGGTQYSQGVMSVLTAFGQMWGSSFHDARGRETLPLSVQAQLLLFDEDVVR